MHLHVHLTRRHATWSDRHAETQYGPKHRLEVEEMLLPISRLLQLLRLLHCFASCGDLWYDVASYRIEAYQWSTTASFESATLCG